MDDDCRPRRHLAKPPADKSPAGQLPADPPAQEEPPPAQPPLGPPAAGPLPPGPPAPGLLPPGPPSADPPPPGSLLPDPPLSGQLPAADLPVSTIQDRSDRRTRRPEPEPEPVYAALLRASGLRPPPGQYEAGDALREWSPGASPALLASARPTAADPSVSERNPRLAASGLLSDPLADRETASLESPLTELASPHPYPRSYRFQLLVPDETPAAEPAKTPAAEPAGKPADPGFLACPVADCLPAQPDVITRSSQPQPGAPALTGDRYRESDPAQPISPARAADRAGGTGGADAAGASDWRGPFGQARALDRRPVGYWATAWEYAGARAGSSVGRHRRFSDRVPRWRRTLLPGGS